MTISEFYRSVNGNYVEISSRFLNDDRIRKYLYIFLEDKTFTRLCKELDSQNTHKAFLQAHTLKGLSQNLSLTSLAIYSDEITQELRNGNLQIAISLLPKLSEEYTQIISAIKKLKETECSNV